MFLQNNSGANGLATWGVEDDGWWRFDLPLVNRRNVQFEYGEGGAQVGGRAWEGELPGPAIGLPPATSVKLYAQEGFPDIGILLAGELEFSFQALFERLGANIIMNDRVQRALGRHWGRLFPIFDRIAENAPSIAISGAVGIGAGVTLDTSTPYVRMLTTAEMNFNTGIFGALPGGGHAARAVQLHEIDMTGGRGGGRSWQISSFANIPTRV